MTEDQVKELEASLAAGNYFLTKVLEQLEKEIEEKVVQSENEFKYESPNWMLYQADNRGYRRGLRKAIALLGA